MSYYHAEQHSNYGEIVARGLSQWNDLFTDPGTWTYDHFQNRAFLETVIPQLDLPPQPSLFEYGCGTGPAACFLAARGFEVTATDLIPEAIDIARRMAAERHLEITFDVADILDMASDPADRQFDIVLDSYVLQSIVTDMHRAALFAAVRARLKPGGAYLISTALFSPDRTYGSDDVYDEESGICYTRIPASHADKGSITINGVTYNPHRRYPTREALSHELASHGFGVLNIAGPDPGDVVCRLAQ